MRYRVVHSFTVEKVQEKITQREDLASSDFSCPEDPASPTFYVDLSFDEDGFIGACLATDKTIQINMIRCVLSDGQEKLADMEDGLKSYIDETLEAGDERGCGWEQFYKPPADVKEGTKWRIRFEFCYVSPSSEGEPIVDSNKPSLSVQTDFLGLFEEATNADVTFLVKGERMMAHKAILSARSEYFKAMFKSDTKENISNEINVPDVEPKVFKGMLQYLYSGLLPKDLSDIAWDLVIVADKYCLQEMATSCVDYVIDKINADNVIDASIGRQNQQ